MKHISLSLTVLLLAVLACGLPEVSVTWPTETPPVVVSPELPPATQPVATMPPPTQPVATAPPELPSVVMPAGVVVSQEGSNRLDFYSPQGILTAQVNAPGLEYAGPENVHVAGGLSGGVIPPVAFFIFESGGRIMLNANGQVSPLVGVPYYASMFGAPGQPILAYATAEFRANALRSQVFVSPVDALSYAGPALVVDDPEGWAVRPLAIRVEGNVPTGIWYTRYPEGIGGDIVFEPRKGLYFLDINIGASTQILSDEVNPSSLSFDHNWVAYSTGEVSTGPLTIYNLSNGISVTIPLLPTSDRGAGNAAFSSSNQYVAWMEGSGWTMAEVPNFHPTIRLGTTNGALLGDYPDAHFDAVLGLDAQWVVPVGWLDEQTLVLDVRGVNWDDARVVKLDASTGGVTILAQGNFVGFYYP